jgi:hypothetical protein
MVKGEKLMPVPEGIISTTTGPVDPNVSKVEEVLEEAIKAADAEVAVEIEKPAPKKRAKKV